MQLADAQSASPLPQENGHSGAAAPVRHGCPAAEELVHAAFGAVLQTALQGLADESTPEEAATAHIDAIQGVVRSLDVAESAANGSVPDTDTLPAAAASTDAEVAQQAIDRYRQEVWDALQGFATAPTSAPAAVAARVHMLDLLSAVARAAGPGIPSRWGDWRPPAAAAGSGPDAQHSLLYSCTRALLEPLWPDPIGIVAPADLADVSAARALFARLLAAAESPQQLGALAELLGDTWRDGAELAPAAADTAQGEQGSAVSAESTGDAAEVAAVDAISRRHVQDACGASDERGGWVPAAAEGDDGAEEPGLCALHDCWAALLTVMVRHGQLAAVVKLVDAHADHPHRLTAAEAHSLATAAYDSAGAFPHAVRCCTALRRGQHSHQGFMPGVRAACCSMTALHAVTCVARVTWL